MRRWSMRRARGIHQGSGAATAVTVALLSAPSHAQSTPAPNPLDDPRVMALIGHAQTPEASAEDSAEMTDAQRGAMLLRMMKTPEDKPVRLTAKAIRPALPPLRDDLLTLLNALDDPSLAQREAASGAMQDSFRVGTLDLLTMGAHARTPEQQNRVVREHRRRFFDTQRAAIGVAFPRAVMDEVREPRIDTLYPQFPASQQGVLQVGDLILQVGEVSTVDPVTGAMVFERMRASILSYDANAVATMVVRRRMPHATYVGWVNRRFGGYHLDQSLLLDVPLGMWAKLPQNPGPGSAVVADAWRIRARRDGLPRGGVVQYGENAAPPGEQARARANIKGHSVHDVLPADIFRDERVSDFDFSPLQEKRFADKQQQQQMRAQLMLRQQNQRRGRRPPVNILGGRERWAGLGRDPNGNPATGITVIERRGSTELHHSEGAGSHLDVARRIAEVRAEARTARRTARTATTPEARDAATARADNLDAQAAALTKSLSLVQDATAEADVAMPGE